MRRRRRTIVLAGLALALPLPAYALTTQSEPAGPASLSVSAALDSCGVSGAQVLCKIDVSFESIPEATSYTASVTSPDGSVTDLGDVPAGGTAVYVPYVGNGTYSVRVSAYGAPAEPGGEPELLDTEAIKRLAGSGSRSGEGEGSGRQAPSKLEIELGGRQPSGSPGPGDHRVEAEVAPTKDCEPAAEPVPVPELTPEEQAAVDADAARVAAGEPSTLDPLLVEKLAAIEAAEAHNAAAAAAGAASPCPAP